MAPKKRRRTTSQPRKQRKAQFNAPIHERRKALSAHLDEDLILKYDRRSLPLRVGDTVEIMRGDYVGEEGEILTVDRKRFRIEIDGVTLRKADGTEVARPVHPSNVKITKLDLSDPTRRAKLERKGVEVEEPEEPPEPARSEQQGAQEDEEEPDRAPEPADEPDPPEDRRGAEPEAVPDDDEEVPKEGSA